MPSTKDQERRELARERREADRNRTRDRKQARRRKAYETGQESS